MSNKAVGFGFEEIPKQKRQSWISLASIWTGSMISIPSLMIGGLLAGGFNMSGALISMIVGYGIICIYMCFVGMQACDTGLPTSTLAAGALGTTGSRFIISALLAITCMGWFGVQTGIAAIAFSTMFHSLTGILVPVWLAGIFWGLVMLATAIFGYNAIKYLNYITIPGLAIVLGYGVWAAMTQNDGMKVIAAYIPAQPMTFVMGVNLVVASFALGGVITGDFARYAHSRRDVIKSSVFGVLPAAVIVVAVGLMLSIVVGQFDITSVLVALGLPVIGLLMLIVATWSTNVVNAFSGGVAVTNLSGAGEKKFKLMTAIAGGIGTVLGAVGIINLFVVFLSILTAFIPPVAGVMIANYWICGKGKRENFRVIKGAHLPGILAFALGAAVAYTTGSIIPFFVAPVNGIVVSMTAYVLLDKYLPKKAGRE
jgi:cytosine permease